MHQGDHPSLPYHHPYHQFPNPNANCNPPPNPNSDQFASAPPFNPGYVPSDYSASPNYPHCPQNPDPIPTPPTAPYTPPTNPNLQSFNSASQPIYFESHKPYQPPAQQQSYFPTYDQQRTTPSYAPSADSVPLNPSPNSNSQYSSKYSASYGQWGASVSPVYDKPYENSVKYDQGGGYFDDRYGCHNQRTRSDLGSDSCGKRYDSDRDDGFRYGVYAYQGNKVEPYGSRATAPKKSSTLFDDYGRSISLSSSKDSLVSSSKIVRAVPMVEVQQEVKSEVQKFRVELLAESGQSSTDVLCQIGLDGIRIVDPSTSRTLRIYPLETITRCEVMDSSTFAFWSKSSVDIEPRCMRLQSNNYTINTLLDTVTAATVQVKEMGGSIRPSKSFKMNNEQSTEKKKGFTDWMTLVKPANEEKDHWVPDEAVTKCTACGTDFGAFVRKHHCRNCGDIFCDRCTHGRIALTADGNAQPVRVCDRCMAEVTQRLNNAKDVGAGLQSHEDLAKKLQEEMEKNRKSSSGSKSDGSGRMREVACPICTVHLQVQVPSTGSETVECGVCQHPFLVSSH